MKKGDVHPMVAAMNTLNYDCGTLGNHEFNYGLDFLQNSLGAAKFPIVCANVIKANGETLQKPWLVLDREVVDEAGAKHPIKIGVIGFVPPQIVQWDKAHLDGKATTIDIVDAAQKHVPDLKKAGADIVVALCHSGIAGGDRKGGEENAALHLAKVDGIDVILTGHQHFTFPGGKEFANIPGVDVKAGTLHGKPAVMAGFWGSHLGLVDLELTKDAAGWKVAKFATDLRPIYDRVDRKVVPKVELGGAHHRGRTGRSRRDAEICARAGGHHRGADPFLLFARRRRRVGEARRRGAGLVRGGPVENHTATRICRCSRRQRLSRPAVAAVRTTSPRSSRVRSPSRTWRTSTSIPTPSAP